MPKVPKAKHKQTVTDMFNQPGDPRNFAPLREEFVDWLAVPPNRRTPKTMQAMAEHLGVAIGTLYNWRKDPRIVSAVKSKIRSVVAIQDLPDIVESLKEQAFNPDNPRSVQASKVLLELVKEGEAETTVADLSDMSNAELRELAAKLHDTVDERIESA